MGIPLKVLGNLVNKGIKFSTEMQEGNQIIRYAYRGKFFEQTYNKAGKVIDYSISGANKKVVGSFKYHGSCLEEANKLETLADNSIIHTKYWKQPGSVFSSAHIKKNRLYEDGSSDFLMNRWIEKRQGKLFVEDHEASATIFGQFGETPISRKSFDLIEV